ncbi:protein S100-A2 isoform X4 [Cervus elaphus]|uniref:protein S100-A2 isoform X3 n=1 Tax=Cervus canadensis TaxID=1574408 RepID=UPI001C9E4E45|nr:protein S100-A2 isoform X3 [Cervus canadensis]XP_043733298.1 protein S100-A2 isoform X4 [Cervus elaphus]
MSDQSRQRDELLDTGSPPGRLSRTCPGNTSYVMQGPVCQSWVGVSACCLVTSAALALGEEGGAAESLPEPLGLEPRVSHLGLGPPEEGKKLVDIWRGEGSWHTGRAVPGLD